MTDDDFEIRDAEDVLRERERQLAQIVSPFQGRLTTSHVELAIEHRRPEVLAVQRAAAKVRGATERLTRLCDERDEVIREALAAGWSRRAVEVMAGVSTPHVQRIAKSERNTPSVRGGDIPQTGDS